MGDSLSDSQRFCAELTVVAEQHAAVDTNGEKEELVRELLKRELLTPALVNEHQGLVGGLLRVRPSWMASWIQRFKRRPPG